MKARKDFIIPECYVDTNLVETLVSTGGCNHQKGCNQVAKVMQEKFADRFAVGMIDADKRQPGYLKEFHEVASSAHLRFLRHGNRHHYIILVHPAIDGFILACAREAGIDMDDYDLSPMLKSFTVQTKNVMSNKDSRFRKLFKVLENFGEIRLMKSLLGYLVDHVYNTANDEIIAIFRDWE